MEVHKNILFVRLEGILNKNNVSQLQENVNKLINDNNIKNIVFNFTGLKSIDGYGINAILENYETIKKNNGKSLVCGLENSLIRHRIDNSRFSKYMYEVSDELSAINYIDI